MNGKALGRKRKRDLRRGFTTGTAAAAGAKAAALAIFTGKRPHEVSVTLPSGNTLSVKVRDVKVVGKRAVATVVKDGGDDPDVTNGAEIVSEVELRKKAGTLSIEIEGGEGVGMVTRPGLSVPVGLPAINPVPREMIKCSLREVATGLGITPELVVTISVPRGRDLAEKTMNPRLGITGGISILGTTGIVEPLSHDAYKDSISCALDIAAAEGLGEVVFSTGRSSEKAVESSFRLSPSAFILTGDHMGFSLDEAARRDGIKKVTIAGQFGKLGKLAAGHFDTHYTRSGVDFKFIARQIEEAGAEGDVAKRVVSANTAREVFFIFKEEGLEGVFKTFCRLVKENAEGFTGGRVEVSVVLAGYKKEIVVRV
jgi:cobalt-precorrin-5B (C1)-methyltransferase